MLNIIIAYFIAGSTQEVSVGDLETSSTIYEKYYTGPLCFVQDYGNYEGKVIWDCDKFFIIYDNENLYRERHRKETLLNMIVQYRFYNSK